MDRKPVKLSGPEVAGMHLKEHRLMLGHFAGSRHTSSTIVETFDWLVRNYQHCSCQKMLLDFSGAMIDDFPISEMIRGSSTYVLPGPNKQEALRLLREMRIAIVKAEGQRISSADSENIKMFGSAKEAYVWLENLSYVAKGSGLSAGR